MQVLIFLLFSFQFVHQWWRARVRRVGGRLRLSVMSYRTLYSLDIVVGVKRINNFFFVVTSKPKCTRIMKMMRARDQMYSEENKKKIVMWNKNMIVGRWYVRDGGSGMIDHIEMAMPQWIGAPFWFWYTNIIWLNELQYWNCTAILVGLAKKKHEKDEVKNRIRQATYTHYIYTRKHAFSMARSWTMAGYLHE